MKGSWRSEIHLSEVVIRNQQGIRHFKCIFPVFAINYGMWYRVDRDFGGKLL